MAWKQGPLPANTWGWGGVVPVGEDASGFYFADFCGDHVKLCAGGDHEDKVLKADEVAFFDNSLELPPTGAKSRKGDA